MRTVLMGREMILFIPMIVTSNILTTKLFFRMTIFLYSPYSNLEGTKDALFYKFKRLTIDQNCSVVCINEESLPFCFEAIF